jgi:hypothetical protein
MHQEFNYITLKKYTANNYPFQCRYIAYKLETEQIKDVQLIDIYTYICTTDKAKYKLTFNDIDLLDARIEKI